MARENQSGVPSGRAMTCTFTAVFAVFHRVVGSSARIRSIGIRAAVNDAVVAFTDPGEGFLETGCPAGQHVQGLVDVAPGGGLGYPETGPELRERLVLPQVHQREKRLLEAAELAPAGVAGLAVLVQQPGDMLDELMRDIEHGRIWKPSGPLRSPM
ncbi:hypothetical protein Shyd_86250 [Streptomyces hydrogenans]|uniref:Uncharacterized protein n=1 Tax=Streptomyces hydrogenans TaxID=1873719 RepID=A0ABQ3PQF0_9ACTN|nr:hypothetical protein GCM10018784_42410 [Streptomyces hydrogenans]GHI27254.1 hypothetical protein Shyd_86250 [Streptomyces hydrogenans]